MRFGFARSVQSTLDVVGVGSRLALGAAPRSAAGNYRAHDDALKVVPIDADERESFLGMTLDSVAASSSAAARRCSSTNPSRAALPGAAGTIRFPKTPGFYDIAVRG